MHRELAKVTSVFLGVERDHNFLAFDMAFDYDGGCSQGLGMIALDSWDKKENRRIPSGQGLDLIGTLLRMFNVSELKNIVGRPCYVLRDTDQWEARISGIELVGWDNPQPGYPKSIIFKQFFQNERSHNERI